MSIRLRKSSQPRASTGRKPNAYYSVADLAERWGMSERHVRRLIEQGHIISHRFGTAVRIAYSNVLLYEAGCISVT